MTTLGFTGTRDGLTIEQYASLVWLVDSISPKAVHHGDCKGADAAFDLICKERGIHRTLWPGTDRNGNSPTRAYCDGETIQQPKPYLVRDQIIAGFGVDGLIACPGTMHEVIRSGTWTTVRKARKLNRKIMKVFPDGTIDTEHPKG